MQQLDNFPAPIFPVFPIRKSNNAEYGKHNVMNIKISTNLKIFELHAICTDTVARIRKRWESVITGIEDETLN